MVDVVPVVGCAYILAVFALFDKPTKESGQFGAFFIGKAFSSQSAR
jgi:hypothetical protein